MAKSAALARAKPFAHRRSCRLTLVPDGRPSAGQGTSGRPSHRNDATLGRSWHGIWSGIASSGADVVLIVLASSFSRQTAKGRPVVAPPMRHYTVSPAAGSLSWGARRAQGLSVGS